VVTLPPSVKEIGVSAFAYSGLEKIIFKKGSELETIGESAFYNCIELKVVTLTPNVKEIGASAFSCSSLEKVIFKEGSKLETIGERVSGHLLLFPNVPRLQQFESYCMQ